MTKDRLRIDVDGGKYTVVQPAEGESFVLRNGEPWLDNLSGVAGSNCFLAMAYEIEELRAALKAVAENESGIDFLSAMETWATHQDQTAEMMTNLAVVATAIALGHEGKGELTIVPSFLRGVSVSQTITREIIDGGNIRITWKPEMVSEVDSES